MPRQGRIKSKTGIYHVLLRGIDKRDIFLDDDDRLKFIQYIGKAKEKSLFKIYAYCLMDNHVHLLIQETVENEEIGTIIKRITVGYVGWHNFKYERTGHLFQNRFKSEPVETESYLLTVLRYIHQNPVKAGMVKNADEYPWSSYNDYISAYNGFPQLIDGELFKYYFPAIVDFTTYMNTDNSDECLEHKDTVKYNEVAFKKVIQKIYSIDNIKQMPIAERNGLIRNIYNEFDISIRQLSQALDVGKKVVEKAIEEDR